MPEANESSDQKLEELLLSPVSRSDIVTEIERALLASSALRLPSMRLHNVTPALEKRVERYSEELEFLKDGFLYGSGLGAPLLVAHLGNAIIKQINNSKGFLQRSDDLFFHALDFEKQHGNLVRHLALNTVEFGKIESRSDSIQTEILLRNSANDGSQELDRRENVRAGSVDTALDMAILEIGELRSRQLSVEMRAEKTRVVTSVLTSLTFSAAGAGIAIVLVQDLLPLIERLYVAIAGIMK